MKQIRRSLLGSLGFRCRGQRPANFAPIVSSEQIPLASDLKQLSSVGAAGVRSFIVGIKIDKHKATR